MEFSNLSVSLLWMTQHKHQLKIVYPIVLPAEDMSRHSVIALAGVVIHIIYCWCSIRGLLSVSTINL